ncbi:Panacea domain-containing protein [Latilactobacillus curvatus]|uniref:XRE family transcriptional regulator n=1 Tax=Latilactobacillus curvatus JCM 1096 = DSM 20019 TaxID=1293592 RepID=A0AAJ0LEQ3_LATCU|nr:type II toxin-antitoxin system antitoxin SocA domain-containing protein [Latilactobacillus curvatus]WCZ54921.1 Cro/CI family transcriptional regulator [Latilactobacillus phage TMW 1.706 P2]KRK92286.1 XRE family transcriptional regulator [Latilactobacillus curvatus JCM 1096 = DSM 20019]MCT3531000.1 DUF4065 domain-containing protein [Latilactobacillus curvatus]MDG2988695.1 DUF4065 domain-containing protein [Latilactobacillus curvatus]QAS49318.1 DUF4065 domain-containing protein [Latilactobaci
MYNVEKIVNWLRVKNHADLREYDYVDELTQMKAMKLLYYIQGTSLVVLKERLFPDDIVAWKYGPVVQSVHDMYAGKREIVGDITSQDIKDYETLNSNPKVAAVLNAVYSAFGNMSAADLVKQTHNESPWKTTQQSMVITDEKLKEYFKTIVTE